MNWASLVIAIACTCSPLFAIEPIRDLTCASETDFHANLGRVISLRGTLKFGVQGPTLDLDIKGVNFYVIPTMPSSGSYTYSESWNQLENKSVQLAGKLQFRSFKVAREAAVAASSSSSDFSADLDIPFTQIPPDYFFVVLQDSAIQRLYIPEPKPPITPTSRVDRTTR